MYDIERFRHTYVALSAALKTLGMLFFLADWVLVFKNSKQPQQQEQQKANSSSSNSNSSRYFFMKKFFFLNDEVLGLSFLRCEGQIGLGIA